MQSLTRAVQAEFLKSKRTLGIWLCLLAPLALAFLELVLGFQYGRKFYRPGTEHWNVLGEHTTVMWAMMLLPLYVTLQMGLLGAMEHNNRTFKQLYALPIPRWVVYAAKAIVGLGLIGLSEGILVLLTVGDGLVFRLCRPELGFGAAIPWSTLLTTNAACYLASWLIIAIQLWVSMHWPSFVVSMGVGIVGTTAGVLAISSDWAAFYPWTMPGTASMNVINLDPVGAALGMGVVGGILVLGLGAVEVSRHDAL